ncbi:hypothetical protein Hanom_Chr15g01341401 [Helianthus anomalus]
MMGRHQLRWRGDGGSVAERLIHCVITNVCKHICLYNLQYIDRYSFLSSDWLEISK